MVLTVWFTEKLCDIAELAGKEGGLICRETVQATGNTVVINRQ